VARPPNLAALLTHCGRLVLRKVSKSDATRFQTLRPKCTDFDFRWRSAPDPAGGTYSAPPDPLAVFKGPTSKGRAREEGGEEEGRANPQKYFGLEPPLINQSINQLINGVEQNKITEVFVCSRTQTSPIYTAIVRVMSRRRLRMLGRINELTNVQPG